MKESKSEKQASDKETSSDLSSGLQQTAIYDKFVFFHFQSDIGTQNLLHGRIFHHRIFDERTKNFFTTGDLVMREKSDQKYTVVGSHIHETRKQPLVLLFGSESKKFRTATFGELSKLEVGTSSELKQEVESRMKLLSSEQLALILEEKGSKHLILRSWLLPLNLLFHRTRNPLLPARTSPWKHPTRNQTLRLLKSTKQLEDPLDKELPSNKLPVLQGKQSKNNLSDKQ